LDSLEGGDNDFTNVRQHRTAAPAPAEHHQRPSRQRTAHEQDWHTHDTAAITTVARDRCDVEDDDDGVRMLSPRAVKQGEEPHTQGEPGLKAQLKRAGKEERDRQLRSARMELRDMREQLRQRDETSR
jgi:hypothetical protein